MKNQKKRPIWQTIILVCIYSLPFALLGVMFVIKQFSGDHGAIKRFFVVTGVVMTLLGSPLKFQTDAVREADLYFMGMSLFWGGAIVAVGSNLIFG